MLILNSLYNGLGCDCGVSRVLILIYHRFCKKYVLLIVYYLWYKAFTESYYFRCVKKTIEQIYQNMHLLNMQIDRNGLFKCSKYTIL